MDNARIEFKANTDAAQDALARANESIGNLHPVADTPNRKHRKDVEARKRAARGWSKARLEREHDALYKLFCRVAEANQAMLAQLRECSLALDGPDSFDDVNTALANTRTLISKLTGEPKP